MNQQKSIVTVFLKTSGQIDWKNNRLSTLLDDDPTATKEGANL